VTSVRPTVQYEVVFTKFGTRIAEVIFKAESVCDGKQKQFDSTGGGVKFWRSPLTKAVAVNTLLFNGEPMTQTQLCLQAVRQG